MFWVTFTALFFLTQVVAQSENNLQNSSSEAWTIEKNREVR